MLFRIAILTLTLTTGLVAAGCGADASLSPTGPSIGASSSRALASDIAASTTEAFAAEGKGEHGKVDADHGHKGTKGVKVTGAITSINTSARTFVVGTQKVSVPVTATIRHGSTTVAFADLKVGDHVQVRGTLNATAVLVASEVKVAGDDDDADKAELTGAVSALGSTACPTITFTVQAKQVSTTATTTFKGITCATVANGTVVEVEGTMQADGSVVATHVSLED
jgi:hypothetical protein